MREAADALVEARAEIAALVRKADSPEALAATLKTWHPNSESWERLGDSIFVPAVMCDLAGQLMVRGSEARTIQLDAKDKPAFLDLPWVDAIEEFKARGIVKPTELSTLLKDYAQRADKARQLMLGQVQTFVRSELEKSLAEGGTFKDFAARIEDGGTGLGITEADPAYLNMVFRTNVQSAYGAGRYRAMTDPDVMDAQPFVEYRTVGDARVREEHAVLDKTVYAIGSDEWQRIAPPNGFNCRCSMVTLTRDEAKGRKVLTAVPEAYVPTPGFSGPPVAKVNAPTPKLAPALQQQPLASGLPAAPETLPVEQPQQVSDKVFGRKPDVEALAGAKADLPAGISVHVNTQESGNGVQLVGALRNDSGNVVGNFTRTFERDGGDLNVRHGFFGIDESYQGTGLGSQLFNAQIDAYEKQGVAKVSLDATDVGRYVWSKAGFEWDDPAQFEKLRAQLVAQLEKRVGPDAAAEIADTLKTPSDMARLVVDGEPVGKQFLIGLEDEIVGMSQSPTKITRL